MTVPTISNLPTVPATSDPNFETEAPALFNHIKNTFVSEMNSAISFINSSTFDATVEFKNSNFTAARNFLYMIDTSSAGVSVTLPLNPSTGDQLLLMDQKRSFGTNNLTIGRNGQNINGAASNVVSKSTGALIRCIFQSSYGWTVDLYEGEWESGTSAGDLVYNGGNVGIGTSSPAGKLDVNTGVMSGNVKIGNFDNVNNGNNTAQFGNGTKLEFIADTNPKYFQHDPYTVGYIKAEYSGSGADTTSGDTDLVFATYDGFAGTANGVLSEKMRITSDGDVGIGTSSPSAKLEIAGDKDATNLIVGAPLHTVSGGGLADYSELLFDNNYTTGTSGTAYIRHYANSHQNSEGALFFGTTSSTGTTSQALVIRGDGNVGIGLGSPSAPLHVDSSTGNLVAKFSSSDEDAYISFEDDGTTTPPLVGANDNDLILWTNNQKRVTIDSSGDVGIGTSSPSRQLDIQNTSSNPFISLVTDPTRDAGIFFGDTDSDSVGRVYYQNSVDDMSFYTAGTEKVRIFSSGDVEVNNGNLVIGTAGKGIDFSATSGTGTSELLDDYEEGTFTPAFEPDSGSFTSITYNRRTGNYTKIGNTVHCWIDISTDLLTVGTASGGIHISGLPFTITAHSTALVGAQSGWITKAPDHAAVQSGQTKISLRWLDQSTQNYQNITTSNLKTGTNSDANRLMGISFSYKTS